MIRLCALFLMTTVLAPAVQAAEILSVEVDHTKGNYTMSSEVWIDATIEQVYEVYRHWDYSTKFSSAIVEARDLEPDEQGRARFYIRHKGCVLFFCRSFERQGYVEFDPNTLLLAFADPDVSDFHFSNERWQFVTRDGGTVVIYNLAMRPKFWIPPGIGPFLIKRKLKNKGGDAIDRIELIAQGIGNE